VKVGPARTGFERIHAALERHGYRETSAWPYAYGTFDNGVPVPEIARSLFAEMGDAVGRFGDPLHTGPGSFHEWLNQSADSEPARPGTVTRLWHAVYRARPDLQIAFPDVYAADREAFLSWTTHGCREHDVSDHFLVSPVTGG
jgi:hypothetical protein